MKQLKSHYKSLAVKPYWWGGFWDNMHHFTKGGNRKGFLTVACLESDLNNGNLAFMLKNEYSR